MNITSSLFDAYLKCSTKCFLRSHGEAGFGNEYADWVRTQTESYRNDRIKDLESIAGRDGRVITAPLTENPKVADWGYVFDFVARAQNLESHIHIVERTPPEEPGKPVQFIPIRFVYTNKFTKNDKLLLAFDALVLSEVLGCEVGLGRIIHGIDEDLLKNPFDTELKCIAQEFGSLLRVVIQTVDRYGLKSRHLRKHKPTVLRFLDSVASKDFTSDLAVSYKRRFQKSGAKMFTFLDHDGVPWNNNNAEHAIKGFAKFRAHADGRFTERSLREYLVLASVFQTCEFNNVNVLKFLLSKENTLASLFKIARRKDHATLRKPENPPLLQTETRS